MYGAIKEAGASIDDVTGRRLANVLNVPWKEEKGGKDPRPARIAGLIIANTSLLQERLHQNQLIEHLESLSEICKAKNKKNSLLVNWKRIQKKDYAPVVGPALQILEVLSSNNQDTEDMLEILVEAVIGCADRVRSFQLDHAGPIYHSLLETARYDGSYYTSTQAAILLAKLALPEARDAANYSQGNLERLSKIKICDPACGTGTLLMAAARTIQERYENAGGQEMQALYKALIEESLHGLDINYHAIHLAASMLTIAAPQIDYDKMHLYVMKYGVQENGDVRAGSIDILIDDASSFSEVGNSPKQERAGRRGYKEEEPKIKGKFDLVIMNPPFTRNDLSEGNLPEEEKSKVKDHKKRVVEKISDQAQKEAINCTTLFTFFPPIGDQLLNDGGTIALIQPVAACMGDAAKGYRKLMTNPDRFHVEAVITSHDNRRIYFSENTEIHESLVVARRPSPITHDKCTAFISLRNNPATTSGSHLLSELIRKAIIYKGEDEEIKPIPDHGTVVYRKMNHSSRAWREACFYDYRIVACYDKLLNHNSLEIISALAVVDPGGDTVRKCFATSDIPQIPGMCALWNHKSERQDSMATIPDMYITPIKNIKQQRIDDLWSRRGHLLLANRFRTNLIRTPAVFSEEACLGSAFVPVTPKNTRRIEEISKAWCVWFNSSLGLLSFLNERTKQLDYPRFSLAGLRSLPVPAPSSCDIAHLASVFDMQAKKKLQALPEIEKDSVRKFLDEAVLDAVPGLKEIDMVELRRWISREPSVHNKIENLD